MHADAVVEGTRVVIVDDLLATGGTAAATADLVRGQGGVVVGVTVVVELELLRGRERLPGIAGRRARFATEAIDVRGRYAPSPTGAMHLGNARTALLAWLDARKEGGAFVMRVEDLDRARVVAGAEARLLADLRWLGLDWDEGPDVGGPFAPYRQSERARLYDDAIDRLLAAGRAFPCACSRADIARAATAPHVEDEDEPRYPGTCRGLAAAEVESRAAAQGRQPSIRYAAGGSVTRARRR